VVDVGRQNDVYTRKRDVNTYKQPINGGMWEKCPVCVCCVPLTFRPGRECREKISPHLLSHSPPEVLLGKWHQCCAEENEFQ
jgi:hypothetical protein